MDKQKLKKLEVQVKVSRDTLKSVRKRFILERMMNEIENKFDEFINISETNDELTPQVILTASIELMSTLKEEPDLTTRSGHLEWCKRRAMEYVDNGDLKEAIASMLSDLQKHPDTAGHPGAMLAIMFVDKQSTSEVTSFIQGFN